MAKTSSRVSETMEQKSLPSNWRWVELGEVCEVRKGVTPRREWYADSGLHIIKFRDIGGEINWEPGLRGRVKPQYEGKLRRLQAGMTLVGADAHNPEYIGKKVSFADSIPDYPVFFSAELLAIAAKPDGRIAFKWPFFWFSSQGGYLAVQEKVVGVHLNSNPAKTIEIPLPPVSEQERIIGILENRMGAVEKARRAALDRVEAARALGASFLREVFKFGNGELPHGWKWGKLGEICKVNPRRPREFVRGDREETSFVPMEAVNARLGKVDQLRNRPYEEVKKGYTYFEDGDVLFAKITPCMQNGKHFVAEGLIDGVGFASTEFHVLRPGSNACAEWVHFYLTQPAILQKATYHFTGSTGQQRVPRSFLEGLKIPFPPLAEQNQILATLNTKMAIAQKVLSDAEAALVAIEALPGALLRQAFRGEV